MRPAVQKLARCDGRCRAAYEAWLKEILGSGPARRKGQPGTLVGNRRLGLANWERACSRPRVFTVDEARVKAEGVRALAFWRRRGPSVTGVAGHGAMVLTARSGLANASNEMVRYDAVGARLVGRGRADLVTRPLTPGTA